MLDGCPRCWMLVHMILQMVNRCALIFNVGGMHLRRHSSCDQSHHQMLTYSIKGYDRDVHIQYVPSSCLFLDGKQPQMSHKLGSTSLRRRGQVWKSSVCSVGRFILEVLEGIQVHGRVGAQEP